MRGFRSVPSGFAVLGALLVGLFCAALLPGCEESPSNGCETDTTFDPAHCGRCNHPCEACAGGQCVDVERVTDEVVVRQAGLAASTTHIYFLAGSSPEETVLRQISKQDGTTDTLLDGLNRDETRYAGLTMGVDRVYFVDNRQLHSVPVATRSVVDEGVATDVAPVVNGEYLYVWTTDGTLRRRRLTSGAEEEIEPWDPGTVSSRAELAPLEARLVVGAEIRGGPGAGWELRVVDWPDSEVIAAGAGILRRVRASVSFDFEVVWLVEHPDGGGPSELFGYGGTDSDALPDRIAMDDGFTDFCLFGELAYASFESRTVQGLRILSKPAPARASVGLRGRTGPLLCDAGKLYFGQLDEPGLFRVTMQDLGP